MPLVGCTILGPPKKHQHLLPWTNPLADGLKILICLQWLILGLMPFRLDGFYAYKHAGVEDGLLADPSDLAHGRPYGLDGIFIGIDDWGVIRGVVHGGHVDIF